MLRHAGAYVTEHQQHHTGHELLAIEHASKAILAGLRPSALPPPCTQTHAEDELYVFRADVLLLFNAPLVATAAKAYTLAAPPPLSQF